MFRLQLCIWHNEGIKQECNETHVSRITSELQLIKIQKNDDYKWNKIKYKFCASLDLSPAVWRFRVWEVLAISTSIACFSTSSCSILILLQALSSLGTALWLRNFSLLIYVLFRHKMPYNSFLSAFSSSQNHVEGVEKFLSANWIMISCFSY